MLNTISVFRRFDVEDPIVLAGTAMWCPLSAGIMLQDYNLPSSRRHRRILDTKVADPERGAIAPPEEPDSHVEEDESDSDVEPELLCPLVESDFESVKISESLADESDVADAEETESVAELFEEVCVSVELVLVIDEAVLELDNDDVELVVMAAVETPETTKAARRTTRIILIEIGESRNEENSRGIEHSKIGKIGDGHIGGSDCLGTG
ncbi:hypothetical protein PPTG_07573 [Phytophthora nicotianae INRA-310]|uniref:Uncharacterized protein n=1 Tax=Phytophthora nicotianae (strain INRA-310) TaxID=761204 RepID=W2QNK1_PHYN3|nr:hypothetical protein PPTG_07573 [Phytophthora nicotianae INRA-310]ETN14546.1 hypothetical protein PPTG_07573 [Phytophthora nicotianae INRA-310]